MRRTTIAAALLLVGTGQLGCSGSKNVQMMDVESLKNLIVIGHAKYAQKRRCRNFPLAVDLHVNRTIHIRFKLKPRSAVRNDFCAKVSLAAQHKKGLIPFITGLFSKSSITVPRAA